MAIIRSKPDEPDASEQKPGRHHAGAACRRPFTDARPCPRCRGGHPPTEGVPRRHSPAVPCGWGGGHLPPPPPTRLTQHRSCPLCRWTPGDSERQRVHQTAAFEAWGQPPTKKPCFHCWGSEPGAGVPNWEPVGQVGLPKRRMEHRWVETHLGQRGNKLFEGEKKGVCRAIVPPKGGKGDCWVRYSSPLLLLLSTLCTASCGSNRTGELSQATAHEGRLDRPQLVFSGDPFIRRKPR